MRIGIHVAWSRQDSAYMAGQLADLAVALGHSVSILSTQPVTGNVYSRWDAEVLGPGHNFTAWLKKQRTVIWFDCQPEKVRLAQNQGCRNLLLALWQRLTAVELPLLAIYDKVICPTKSVLERLARVFPQGRYALAEWDTLTTMGRPESVAGYCGVFVPLDGSPTRADGPMTLHALRMLAERDSLLHFTLGRSRRWSRDAWRAYTAAASSLPKQFRLVEQRSWEEWTQELSRHDWLFNPSLQENVGLTNIAAAYLRVPTVAFDVPPVSDLIKDGQTGMLAPCDVVENDWGVPSAVALPRKLLDVLELALGDVRLGRQLTGDRTATKLRSRRQLFRAFWDRELEQTELWA